MAKGKSAYWLSTDGLLLVSAWARDGLTDRQIAKNMGIARSTLYVWKAELDSFAEALQKGKEVVDVEVENALLKKALGYTVQVKKTFKLKMIDYDPDTGKKVREWEELRTGIEEEHVPPNTTAQIWWLKNRQAAKWRDKQEIALEEQEPFAVNIQVME